MIHDTKSPSHLQGQSVILPAKFPGPPAPDLCKKYSALLNYYTLFFQEMQVLFWFYNNFPVPAAAAGPDPRFLRDSWRFFPISTPFTAVLCLPLRPFRQRSYSFPPPRSAGSYAAIYTLQYIFIHLAGGTPHLTCAKMTPGGVFPLRGLMLICRRPAYPTAPWGMPPPLPPPGWL